MTSDMKKLVRKGKEEGFILISELDKLIEELSAADQQYIRDGMEELKIQIVKTPKDYDEYKYMTGEEAVQFLQSLSDGKTKAFVKDEEVQKITKYLNEIDLVIVMTVIPGFGGQKFLYEQVSKIKKLLKLRQSMKANFEIEIDGGINQQTSKVCIDNGADVLVAGSYIYGSQEEKYEELINSIR